MALRLGFMDCAVWRWKVIGEGGNTESNCSHAINLPGNLTRAYPNRVGKPLDGEAPMFRANPVARAKLSREANQWVTGSANKRVRVARFVLRPPEDQQTHKSVIQVLTSSIR